MLSCFLVQFFNIYADFPETMDLFSFYVFMKDCHCLLKPVCPPTCTLLHSLYEVMFIASFIKFDSKLLIERVK